MITSINVIYDYITVQDHFLEKRDLERLEIKWKFTFMTLRTPSGIGNGELLIVVPTIRFGSDGCTLSFLIDWT